MNKVKIFNLKSSTSFTLVAALSATLLFGSCGSSDKSGKTDGGNNSGQIFDNNNNVIKRIEAGDDNSYADVKNDIGGGRSTALAEPADAQAFDVLWYAHSNEATRFFTISTAEELAGLAQIVNGTWDGEANSFKGMIIKLAGNIDLSGHNNWMPIGNNLYSSFSGTFDGCGHVISNLTINRPDTDYQGLFGNISYGRVENLGLERVNIKGNHFVGGVAGRIFESSVIRCYSTGVINSTGEDIGGVVGSVCKDSHIISCYSTNTISGGVLVGGVVGRIIKNSSVTNCYSTGAVSGDEHVGGIVGNVEDTGSVANSVALNPYVKSTGKNVGRTAGNISGTATLLNNMAYNGMKNNAGNTTWVRKGADANDSDDIIVFGITVDGTIGGRFKSINGWTTEPGKLPGLHGAVVELPEHLK